MRRPAIISTRPDCAHWPGFGRPDDATEQRRCSALRPAQLVLQVELHGAIAAANFFFVADMVIPSFVASAESQRNVPCFFIGLVSRLFCRDAERLDDASARRRRTMMSSM